MDREAAGDAEDRAAALDEVFGRLQASRFRRRFRLGEAELEYLRRRGWSALLRHAAELTGERLAPAQPVRDGSQTPMRGHPVFIAQHATATCCRGCLEKWHGVERGRELSADERAYVVRVIERWLRAEEAKAPPPPPPAQLGLDV